MAAACLRAKTAKRTTTTRKAAVRLHERCLYIGSPILIRSERAGYGFQFNSFPTRQPSPVVLPRPTSFTAAAPKFAVAAAVNASNESDESDEDEDGDAVVLSGLVHSGSNSSLGLPPTATSTPVASAENTPRNEVEMPAVLPPATPSPIGRYEPKQLPEDLQPKHEPSEDDWAVDGSINGVEAISEAVVQNLQPSLEAAIQRIAELLSSQQVYSHASYHLSLSLSLSWD